jgi:hypothetical protein
MNKQLFQIQLLHGYFADGLYQYCKVLADSDTIKLMDRYKLLTRMRDGIFSVYMTCQDSAVAFVSYLNDQLQGEPLRFLLAANEEQFVSITDVPFDWCGQMGFSSKLTIPENTQSGTPLQLKAELGNRTVSQQNVIGVICIYLDDLLVMGCNSICYVIEFKARAMHWVYYLINRSQTKLNNPMICNKERYFFDGPESVVLSNGEKGLSFNSGDRLFPLEQVPTKLFDLVDRLPASMHAEFQPVEHCLIQGLPTPNAGQFSVRQKDTKKYMCSEMYIYL